MSEIYGGPDDLLRWHPQRHLIRRIERMRAARERGTHTKDEWEALKLATDHFCVKCGEQFGYLVQDHIVPVCQGGCDCIANIQPLCERCNSRKGGDDTDYRVRVKYWCLAFIYLMTAEGAACG